MSPYASRAVEGLSDDQLAARAGRDANPIAWLVWHLTRVQDDHVADVAGTEQVWTAQGFVDRVANPADGRGAFAVITDTGREAMEATTADLEAAGFGLGMLSSEEQDRLFSRFFRSSLAVADQVQGTGLGLALVQSVVEWHDGTVEVESAEGEGTTVVRRGSR